jgi:putative tricarboxylic transport membrane protein
MGLASRPAGHAGVVKGAQDLLCGLLFVLIGAAGLWIGRDYPMGTSLRLGTGVFPRLLCWGLVGVGAIVMARGLLVRGPGIGGWAWRPVLLVAAAAGAFALLIEPAGLFVSMIVMMALGGLAGQEHRPKEFAVFATVMLLLAWAIFIWGLEMPIKVFPWN